MGGLGRHLLVGGAGCPCHCAEPGKEEGEGAEASFPVPGDPLLSARGREALPGSSLLRCSLCSWSRPPALGSQLDACFLQGHISHCGCFLLWGGAAVVVQTCEPVVPEAQAFFPVSGPCWPLPKTQTGLPHPKGQLSHEAWLTGLSQRRTSHTPWRARVKT